MKMQDYKRELKMFIENIEPLYRDALAITDFDWSGEQVDNLYMKTWARINQANGENVAPELVTDKDVKEVKTVVVDTAKLLQHEAKL